MQKTYFVYILSNRTRRLYVGVANNLIRRLAEHRSGVKSVFTHHYNIHRLFYFEPIAGARAAISREKQIKGWRREKKVSLIQTANPDWEDLSIGW
jgi:putative endonuclease